MLTETGEPKGCLGEGRMVLCGWNQIGTSRPVSRVLGRPMELLARE